MSEASRTGARRIGPSAYWPTDESMELHRTTIGAVLRDRAATVPDTTAVFWLQGDDLRSMTYARLLEQSLECAARIMAVTQSAGDRVAVWTPNTVEWVVVYYACALSGRVLVPLNPMLSDGEFVHSLQHCGAPVVLAAADFRDRNLLGRAKQLAPELGVRAHDLRRWADLPTSSEPLPEVGPADPLLIQYTSGTTGKPKGAVLSHSCAYNNAQLRGRLMQPGDAEVWCSPAGFHHVGGSVSRVLGALALSGAVVVVTEPKGSVVVDLLERTRVTHAGLIGKLALDFLDAVGAGRSFPALTSVALGGTTVTPDVVQRIIDAVGVAVVNGYGQSETPHITGTRSNDSLDDRLHTIGRPLPQRELCIMRPGTGEYADLDETGEICTRGPLIMDGYFEDPVATAATIDENGWLHTGDLGSMDERGFLTFRGRLREVVIRGGENVYPVEVEGALALCDGVEEVAVVGVPDARWGEQLLAVVRARPGAALDAEVLRAHAAGHLAPFKIPRYWRFTSDMPRTASGKIRKNALVDTFGAELSEPEDAPADASRA
ncbi:class I adenylate-forming enzyme family protein [Actinomadura bangladeshensis]|uniref:AMP-dependent synthetase n=1 Tax=Actinomadura bangladeshensis TaxID=453573 RepID=A0A4R4PCY3_9ACTN|nr:class I adenylate-forming enzyme family protein [Actinomadura bangladeshensis]TDC20345.1 AMP-dependent synthetase [Actinomadura bangladeshensis]